MRAEDVLDSVGDTGVLVCVFVLVQVHVDDGSVGVCRVCRRSVLAGRVHAVCCVRRGDVHGVGGFGQLRFLHHGSVQQRQCVDSVQHVSRRTVRHSWPDLAVSFEKMCRATVSMCRVCVRYSTATAATSCAICAAGQYSPGGSTPCAACTAGYYSNSSGAAVCSACAAGRFAATAGLATCTTCSGGQYVLISEVTH